EDHGGRVVGDRRGGVGDGGRIVVGHGRLHSRAGGVESISRWGWNSDHNMGGWENEVNGGAQELRKK
ncbi:MAG TPA: hypothetical protein VH475_06085, partial [Tepidisphaeraceae bacterium]